MEIEPSENPPQITSIEASTTEASLLTPVSFWEDYLTGRKVPANKFLAKMEKGAITIPDEAARLRFAKAFLEKPDRTARLILLLQASHKFGDTIRRIVVAFAEAGIEQLNVVSFEESLDAAAFGSAVRSWLASIRRKPLKSGDLNILFLLLHLGWYRQLIDEDTVLNLITLAISKPEKTQSKAIQPPESALTPIEVLLDADPKVPILSTLVAYSKASKTATDRLNAHILAQETEIGRLTAQCAELNTVIADFHARFATLQELKANDEAQIAAFEKQNVEIRDGYQHKLYELRGRIRGVLQGQLTRWLQTALDASCSDPPFVEAIRERLEDALALIEKEIQWLQPSA